MAWLPQQRSALGHLLGLWVGAGGTLPSKRAFPVLPFLHVFPSLLHCRFMNHRVPSNRRYQPTDYEHAANCATHAVSLCPLLGYGTVPGPGGHLKTSAISPAALEGLRVGMSSFAWCSGNALLPAPALV